MKQWCYFGSLFFIIMMHHFNHHHRHEAGCSEDPQVPVLYPDVELLLCVYTGVCPASLFHSQAVGDSGEEKLLLYWKTHPPPPPQHFFVYISLLSFLFSLFCIFLCPSQFELHRHQTCWRKCGSLWWCFHVGFWFPVYTICTAANNSILISPIHKCLSQKHCGVLWWSLANFRWTAVFVFFSLFLRAYNTSYGVKRWSHANMKPSLQWWITVEGANYK